MATRVQWLGHATMLVNSDGQNILIDPFFIDNPKAPIKFDEATADFIVVSHGHIDHIGDTISIAKRTGAMVISNYEIVGWLQKQGIKQAHPLQHGGGHTFPFGRCELTLAFHGSALPDGSYGGNPAGVLLTLNDGKKVYNAADTALFGDMRLIGEKGLDLALLPIGDNFTMGPDDAVRAVQLLEPKKVVPIHYDTWPLIAQDANAWAEQVRQKTKAEPIVLHPGEWVNV